MEEYFRKADNPHSKRTAFFPRNHYLFCPGNHDYQRIFGDRCCLIQRRVAAKEKYVCLVASLNINLKIVINNRTFVLNSSSPFVCSWGIKHGLHNKLISYISYILYLIAVMLWRTWSIVASCCPHQQMRLSLPHISVGQNSGCYARLVRARSRDCLAIASGLSNSVVQILLWNTLVQEELWSNSC